MIPFGREITVTSRVESGKDAYNNAVFSPTTVTVTGAFAPASGTETLDNEDQVVTTPLAFLPAGTVVDANSKLTINGTDYEVTGDPEEWASPFTGWAPGIRVQLRRTAG